MVGKTLDQRVPAILELGVAENPNFHHEVITGKRKYAGPFVKMIISNLDILPGA